MNMAFIHAVFYFNLLLPDYLEGSFIHYTALKSLSRKVVGIFCCQVSESRYERLDSKLEKKMMEIKRNAAGQNNFRSVNGIIMKFPQLKEGLKEIRDVFEQYGEHLI